MSATQTFHDGKWRTGNFKTFGINENASWLGMSIFDGARSFDGAQPDLDLHCQRSIASAKMLLMNPGATWQELYDIVIEGVGRFPEGTHLYIRITFWDQTIMRTLKSSSIIAKFSIALYEVPLVFGGSTANLSKFVRPAPNQAPTGAKASCLYPNSILAINAANDEGFSDAVMLDINHNVAEFTMSNLFMVKDGVVHTPIPNGHFLNGITRQRVIKLLKEDGYTVNERTIAANELDNADEIFSTGNISKVKSLTKYKDKKLGLGPVTQRAWDLYMNFAHKE